MPRRRTRGLRRHLSLLVPGLLVLLIGGLGLVAGQHAGQQAREVHRADRLSLQRTLAGLVEQHALVSAAEVQRALQDGLPWSSSPGSPVTHARLTQLVDQTRTLDAGAVLLNARGETLQAAKPDVGLPADADAGWAPLRASVLSGRDTLPVSGILHSAAGAPVLAMGLPVQLDDGTRGLLIGLWSAAAGDLQRYVEELTYGTTGHGYVIDAAGLVLAGPRPQDVGERLPMEGVLRQLERSPLSGLLDTEEDGRELVTSYTRAGDTGWTALTVQDAEEFEGALQRSTAMVQVAVVALLLSAGAGLVVLHRKRELALSTAARRDELTGLYNRRGWFSAAERELAEARRTGQSRALLFIDLDGLKQVNDVLGHREGDRAIQDAARVLDRAAHDWDVVGRLGGDEFVVLIGQDGHAEAARDRLNAALAAHNAASEAGFELRLSVGAEVWFPDEACSLDELVRRADAMMYVEKSSRPDRSSGLLRSQDRASAPA
jgi:diguanylate cyclase (GGDEF)-like protein